MLMLSNANAMQCYAMLMVSIANAKQCYAMLCNANAKHC